MVTSKKLGSRYVVYFTVLCVSRMHSTTRSTCVLLRVVVWVLCAFCSCDSWFGSCGRAGGSSGCRFFCGLEAEQVDSDSVLGQVCEYEYIQAGFTWQCTQALESCRESKMVFVWRPKFPLSPSRLGKCDIHRLVFHRAHVARSQRTIWALSWSQPEPRLSNSGKRNNRWRESLF